MNKVVSKIYGHGRGWAFSPNDFNGLSSRDAIRKALSRLEESGTIRRVLHGIYDYPRNSKFTEGFLGPDPEKVALAIARKFKWDVQPSGTTALNVLGLSTQVVAQYVYSSNGPTRTFKWGEGAKVVFRHTKHRDFADLSPKTALIILAVKALGREHVTARIIEKLQQQLTRTEKSRALKESRSVTGWVFDILLQVCKEVENG
ncbi:MAG: hypothetical protein JNL74_03360 [Fibrobacteres bacterium]|nr:hypothetical protein [Fibrobacterota bacterium]